MPLLQESNIRGDLVIALDGISDPGNLGTIIRTAWWFNVNTILLSKNSADPFNQKVLRSSLGGVFHINLLENTDLAGKLSDAASSGYEVYLFDLNAEAKLQDFLSDQSTGILRNSILVFGNESSGLSENILKSALEFRRVKIDGYAGAESLNVAISCGIALYEFRKLVGG